LQSGTTLDKIKFNLTQDGIDLNFKDRRFETLALFISTAF